MILFPVMHLKPTWLAAACVAPSHCPKSSVVRYAISAEMPSREFGRERATARSSGFMYSGAGTKRQNS
jgi:hypothetical protein